MRIIILLAGFLLAAAQAQAHPHAFIELRTTLVLNQQGELAAVKEHWVFDQYYTEFALHEFGYKKGGALDRAKVLELARENLKGLKDFQYFTSFEDKAVQFGAATDVNSYLEGGQIAMDFTLPLAKAVKLPTTLRIYDPSYYTAMQHGKGGVQVEGTLPPGCATQIARANPDTVWVGLASALDLNATAPEDLGRNFAETIRVTCK